jgi:Zn finger protein HypA/HybF involved in hydrogenase expression
MRITEAPGLHYCHDCGALILDEDHESVWYCPIHAKKRGWNIIDGRRIKVNENKNGRPIIEGNQTTQEGESSS